MALTFTAEQFEALVARLAPANSQGPHPEAVRAAVIAGPVAWSDLPTLDPSKPSEVDAWFMKFEAKLKAAKVEAHRWAEKLEECPRVPQSLKTRLPAEALTDYATARRWVLKEHGPLNPVGHFRAMIYRVRGDTRDKVREELENLLVLYNRAAGDFDGPVFSKHDLIHPFIDAFPSETSQGLTRDLAFAMAQGDPFEQLYYRAPEKGQPSETMLSVLEEAPEPEPKRPRMMERRSNYEDTQSPPRDSTQEKLDRVLSQLAAITERSDGGQERNRTPCSGCAGRCRSREDCPAQGRTCHNCGALNHFAAVCRRPRFPRQYQAARPFRQGPQRAPPQ